MSDKYDKAIAWLNRQENFNEAVSNSWCHRVGEEDKTPATCLFLRTGRDSNCGCLTQLRGRPNYYKTDLSLETKAEIAFDLSLPTLPDYIEPHHLEHFAKWQRRIDKELKRCSTMLTNDQ